MYDHALMTCAQRATVQTMRTLEELARSMTLEALEGTVRRLQADLDAMTQSEAESVRGENLTLAQSVLDDEYRARMGTGVFDS